VPDIVSPDVSDGCRARLDCWLKLGKLISDHSSIDQADAQLNR
jgi:hypothetical protein